MSWRTRRWWPSAQGWWLFALPLIGFALTGRILTAHSDPPLAVWLGIPLLVMALLTIPAVAAIEFIPSNHQRTTARWTLRFDADAVTFIERPSGRSVKTTTIPRSEAGRIEISLLQAFDRRGKPLNLYEVDQVTAWSLDESSSMTLIPRYVYFGRFRSRERRPPRLLASWWPTNGLSEPSLDDFKKRPLRIYGH